MLILILTNKMPAVYHSETTNWSSEPRNGNVYGTRNIVDIKNGKGYKIHTYLNKQCKPKNSKKTVKKTLTKNEINSITKGTFLPGFWNTAERLSDANSLRGKSGQTHHRNTRNHTRHMRQNEGKRLYK